jgi:peptide/nickel transport system substrate-binding protein
MEIEAMDWATFLERLEAHEFAAQLGSWTLDIDPDPFDFWHSSQIEAGSNYASYADPDVDRWSSDGRATFDLVRRAALYHKVQRRLHRDQPFTFMFHAEQIFAVDGRVQGMRATPTGLWDWYPSTLEWWVPQARQRYPAGPEDPG